MDQRKKGRREERKNGWMEQKEEEWLDGKNDGIGSCQKIDPMGLVHTKTWTKWDWPMQKWHYVKN